MHLLEYALDQDTAHTIILMPLPSSHPDDLSTQLKSVAQALAPQHISGNSGANSSQLNDSTVQHLASLDQLGQIIANANDNTLDPVEYTKIGEFAMNLMGDCSQLATQQQNSELQQQIGLLAVSCLLWVTKQGGEINALEPIVDTLARLAKHTKNLKELLQLSDMIGRLIDACSLDIRNDMENMNPERPWRVININRGIVATRSLDPDVMETAFQALIKNLPQDAPGFFAEGMAEMERLGYPQYVRKVMNRYFEQWNEPHIIH